MLVLSRKSGEAVLVGENVAVKVIRVEGSRVVLGFDAPRDVAIRRPERMAEMESAVGQPDAA